MDVRQAVCASLVCVSALLFAPSAKAGDIPSHASEARQSQVTDLNCKAVPAFFQVNGTNVKPQFKSTSACENREQFYKCWVACPTYYYWGYFTSLSECCSYSDAQGCSSS